MTMPPHLCIVTLAVDDLARSEAFYSGLGWRRAESSIDGVIVWYDVGGGTYLGLFGRQELADDAALASAERGPFGGFTLAINVASPAEVDAALAAAVAAGGTMVKPGKLAEWGGYSGYVADPDGHLWEVAHNPGFPLRPEGGIDIR